MKSTPDTHFDHHFDFSDARDQSFKKKIENIIQTLKSRFDDKTDMTTSKGKARQGVELHTIKKQSLMKR